MSARWTSGQLAEHQQEQAGRGQKRPKYGNRATVVDGIRFDSAKEARHYQALRLLEKTGVIEGFDRQVKYELRVCGQLVGKYYADFVVRHPDGRVDVQDTKGVRTPVYKLKKRLMKAIHGIEIIEI